MELTRDYSKHIKEESFRDDFTGGQSSIVPEGQEKNIVHTLAENSEVEATPLMRGTKSIDQQQHGIRLEVSNIDLKY